ncbi:hypothetical protein G4B88_010721 [Cannabis sativa]|uniref:Uncharacterized protein n=1 Tax=Cannabis sativa TaxID=3483 RepID=A0A7J6F7K6_CANSA|nr:hypothetical protein G4B88_010721 [Cannabis sativa]
MDRGGRASQMIDLVNLEEKWLDDVVSDHLESGVTEMVHHVLFSSSEKIINDNHAVTTLHETVHEVRPDETCSASNNDPLPLSLQPQRNLTPGIPVLNPETTLVVHRAMSQVARFELGRERIKDRGAVPLGSLVGREERETQSSYSNADENKCQPLFAEDVSNRTGHG